MLDYWYTLLVPLSTLRMWGRWQRALLRGRAATVPLVLVGSALLLNPSAAAAGGANRGEDAYGSLVLKRADDDYTAAAVAAGEPAAARPPLHSRARLTPRAGSVALHNAALLAGGPPALQEEGDALYVIREVSPPGSLRRLAHVEDVDLLTRGVTALVCTRGCSEAEASACLAAARCAAAADAAGLIWVVIDDGTPADVVDAAEVRLNLHLQGAPPDAEPHPPLCVLLDRFGNTAVRYVYEPAAGAAVVPVDSTVAAAGVAEPLPHVSRSRTPSVRDVSAWTAAFAIGELEPTLLGMPRPPHDAHPRFPFVSVVTGPESFSDVVLDPRTDVVLEAFLSDCPMCHALASRMRMLGLLVSTALPATQQSGCDGSNSRRRSPPPPLRVAVMNVDENERPRHWMPGPAFPTIQLFNASGAGKLAGPDCAAAAPATTLAVSGVSVGAKSASAAATVPATPSVLADVKFPSLRAVGCVAPGVGTPTCVPSLDFAHPTSPGRMALPTVPELMVWVARHCSRPFDPTRLELHPNAARSLFKDAASRFPEYAPAGSSGGESNGGDSEYDSVPPPEQHHGSADAETTTPPLRLMDLAADMEVEARMFDAAVFHVMWLESVLEQARTAATKMRAHPADASAGAELSSALPRLSVLLEAAKSVVLEGGMYGAGAAAEEALSSADSWVAARGIVGRVRTALREQDERKAEDEAVGLARELVVVSERLR